MICKYCKQHEGAHFMLVDSNGNPTSRRVCPTSLFEAASAGDADVRARLTQAIEHSDQDSDFSLREAVLSILTSASG